MIQSLNLVFCGTPSFAVPTLDKMVETGFQVRLVVTQPDRPKGRGLALVASPVKQRALQLGLPITQPEGIKNNDAFRAQLTDLKTDTIIVVGYGRIIGRIAAPALIVTSVAPLVVAFVAERASDGYALAVAAAFAALALVCFTLIRK